MGLRLLGSGLEGLRELVFRRGEIPLTRPEHPQAKARERLPRIERHRVAVEGLRLPGPAPLIQHRAELRENVGIPGTDPGQIPIEALRIAEAALAPRRPGALQEPGGGDVPRVHPKVNRVLDRGKAGVEPSLSAAQHLPAPFPVPRRIPGAGQGRPHPPGVGCERQRSLEEGYRFARLPTPRVQSNRAETAPAPTRDRAPRAWRYAFSAPARSPSSSCSSPRKTRLGG